MTRGCIIMHQKAYVHRRNGSTFSSAKKFEVQPSARSWPESSGADGNLFLSILYLPRLSLKANYYSSLLSDQLRRAVRSNCHFMVGGQRSGYPNPRYTMRRNRWPCCTLLTWSCSLYVIWQLSHQGLVVRNVHYVVYFKINYNEKRQQKFTRIINKIVSQQQPTLLSNFSPTDWLNGWILDHW